MDNPAENHEVLEDLKYAIQHLNYKEMEDILENIDDLNAILNGEPEDNQIFAGTNPLIFLIIQHGDKRPIKCLKCVEFLIRKKIDLEFKGNDDRTALSWARELRMTDTVNLIESRLKEPQAERELSIQDGLKKYFEEGRENYIININHTQIVNLNNDLNIAPPKLNTPLQLCCSLNYTISAAYLLDHGADSEGIAEKRRKNKNTPIRGGLEKWLLGKLT
ncbi:uncharacterized protein LOC115889736 [Sitophilus oryzae]|uniref:Uncharacterized protein LOC115889736 n=1 Tax=Sitophilus oryzae TaxID=7048 RepID=A0A6J2YSB1_SITOR|nr:uncharacterized protein LOC115889736 [Sitophilus oryzae]XP_030765675.1 uncharacterized protein LOC115889736 [Sitophilus oryzae]